MLPLINHWKDKKFTDFDVFRLMNLLIGGADFFGRTRTFCQRNFCMNGSKLYSNGFELTQQEIIIVDIWAHFWLIKIE